MVSAERMPDWSVGPCPSLQPSIRLLALLRDPGERSQSAFNYQLQNCICNFKFPWCTMFTSFRFKQRQQKLCDDHTPRHGMAAALSAMRTHGNMPWPITSSETHHLLGRFGSLVIREAYAPWFGSYQSSVGGRRISSILARQTLAHCFAWVGIAEDLALSLQLLKLELPTYFKGLDVEHFKWEPTTGPSKPGGDPEAGNHSQHPYLRSNLLVNDYNIYDAERRRLFARAERNGIAVWGAPPPQ